VRIRALIPASPDMAMLLSQVLLSRERLPPYLSGLETGFVRPEVYILSEVSFEKSNTKLIAEINIWNSKRNHKKA
jgi:hypothetical protein